MSDLNKSSSTEHRLIAVDWGTTNFRSYLIDEYGVCIDSISNDDGVIKSSGHFELILQRHIGQWLNSKQATTVVLSGMIGSQIGWFEAPYVDCPVSVNDFGKHVIQIKSFNQGNCWLVPGAKYTSDSDVLDVMRGEELQVIGAYQLQETNSDGLFCCPGTHNKWVSVKNGQMKTISTSMTGEAFSLLKQHSILSHSLEDEFVWHEKAFISGLKYSQRSGGLLNHLFSVRTKFISGQQSKEEGSSYLSGLLIGHEIHSIITSQHKSSVIPTTIIGSSQLCQSYSQALTYFGVANYCVPAQLSTVAGVYNLFTMIKEKK